MSGRAVKTLVTAVVAVLPVFAARYALLVANSSGGPGMPALQYADNDVVRFRSVLTDVCGFDPANVTVLLNGLPQELDDALDAVLPHGRQPRPDDLVLFYYSGHADAENLKMGTALYGLPRLRDRFTSLPASIRIAVFDACQSGAFTRSKGGKLAEPFMFREDEKIEGTVILSSSSESENSQESDLYRNSVFTFHFVNALRGSADASGDGRVTLSEAYQYSYNRTVAATARSSGGAQHPGYQFRIQGEGDIVLADLNARTSGVILPDGLSGDITITDSRGNLMADFSKEPAATVMIALNPGEYSVSCRSREATTNAAVTVDARAPRKLALGEFSRIDPKANRAKGGQGHTRGGPVLRAGYEDWNLAELENGLAEAFDGYRMFGIDARPAVPAGAFGIRIGGEVWIADRVQVSASFGYNHLDASETLTGRTVNPIDGLTRGYRLSYETGLQVIQVSAGTGVKFRKGIMKNFVLHAGVSLFSVEYTVQSSFNDSLYDFTADASYHESGGLALPVAGVSYRFPLTPLLEFGVDFNYRYQHIAAMLDTRSGSAFASAELVPDEDPPGFSYDFGGFNGQIFLSVLFPGR